MAETRSEVPSTVTKLKSAHRQWRKRLAWSLAGWLVVGNIVGIGTWFAQAPRDRDAILFGSVAALVVGVFLIGAMITRMFLPKPILKCPNCGYDFQGSDPTDDWLTWKCCPGCGLKMTDGTNDLQKS
jgi:hypothetical protein